MKVAVIGANGQLGTDICRVYRQAGHKILELNHDQIEIRDFGSCQKALGRQPDLVVNTAAMHNVEDCEDNPQAAFAVNGIGARNLALLSRQMDFSLVYVSTDYVFDGGTKTPYLETACPLPVNVYGNTKLAGEIFICTLARKFFIVRVSGLYGSSPCRAKGGLNFVQLMLRLAKERDEVRVIEDEQLSPTHTLDIAKQLEKLTSTEHYGLYHMVSQGYCSWYEFARKIFEFTGTRVKLFVAGPDEFPKKAPRPRFSALENGALKRLGLDIMPHWSEALRRYLVS